MSPNSSAFSNGSRLLSSFNPALPFGLDCFIFDPGHSVFTIYAITILLFILPVCILVLYHGFQRWWKERPFSTAATMSHSDSFTYHSVAMKLMDVFGSILYCCCIYTNQLPAIMVWFFFFSFAWFGETFFHVLACVEHYLAVVHPITYLSLRKGRWIRIRNIISCCIWLLCVANSNLMNIKNTYIIFELCILIFCLIIISFCCLSVLCVLIRPGPGKQGRDSVRVDQSKQRAFYTIVAILAVLVLRVSWSLVWTLTTMVNGEINGCVGIMCEIWINVPSSLMLPLLFLQRTGTLSCCRKNIK